MADALKDMFNISYYRALANELKKVDKHFNDKKFIADVTKDIQQLSLNERLRNTSVVLNKYFTHDYKKTIEIMKDVVPQLRGGYTTLVFPDYVGLFGKEDMDTSLDALKYFTQFGSSEFAIREFLKMDFSGTIRVMEKWAEDNNVHVRRLASEGSRARLPWSFKLDKVIKDPRSTYRIIEALKTDTEPYVKKSVANHLNDISKDNPDYMLSVIGKWDRSNEHTAWIAKHASRTLIKKGNPKTLAVFNFEKNVKVELLNFKLNKTKIKLGDTLMFSFDIVSKAAKAEKLVVDYIVHYCKSGKQTTQKVFKLKEIELGGKQSITAKKAQLFKDFSTRKHYPGKHRIEIMINGKVYGVKEFFLDTNA